MIPPTQPWTFRPSRPNDAEPMYDVWHAAVLATHDFVAASDLAEICQAVRADYLPHNRATVAVDRQDNVIAFMELSDGEIVSLFIHPNHRGRGLGRAFVSTALAQSLALCVTVNEQNAQAVGFYQAMGFVAGARSDRDEDGRPYPMVRMHIPPATAMIFDLEPCHDLTPDEVDAIEDRLYAHNSQATGRDDARGLAFRLRDAAGQPVAVAAGFSWSGTAELKQLWVSDSWRGRGYGARLLDAFTAEARLRGVHRIWVASHDFQAPAFYEKAGFKRMAEFADWPEGHVNVVLCKTLTDIEGY